MRHCAIILFLLAGCNAATQQRPSQQEMQQRYAQALRSQCVAYGVAESVMTQCMMQLHQANLQAQAAQRQADVAAGAAMLGYSQWLLQLGSPVMAPVPPHITCQQFGTMTTCN